MSKNLTKTQKANNFLLDGCLKIWAVSPILPLDKQI